MVSSEGLGQGRKTLNSWNRGEGGGEEEEDLLNNI